MEMINKLPLYLQIKNQLVKRILSYHYKDKIPGEMVLSNEFNVARGTVQQALDELVRAGVLYKQQGRGTFVNRNKLKAFDVDLPELFADCYPEDTVKSTVNSVLFTMAHNKLANKMGLNVGNQIIKIYRSIIDVVSEKTIGFGITYLNAKFYNDLPSFEHSTALYQKLKELFGFLPIKAEDTLVPIIFTADILQKFTDQENSLGLYLERLGKNIDGETLEYTEFYLQGAVLIKNRTINPLDLMLDV